MPHRRGVHTAKVEKVYKIKDWSDYNQALVNRGSVDFWIDKRILEKWYSSPSGKQGASVIYSDLAIQLTLQLGIIFNQRLRQTEELVNSLFRMMNVHLTVPDYTTLSRRAGNLNISIKRKNINEPLTVIADSTGLKVYGEGEWKVRKHGWSKHRTWMKIHLSITPEREIRSTVLTNNSVTDAQVIPNLYQQETCRIKEFLGDGAYDKFPVYQYFTKRHLASIIAPPMKKARIRFHGNLNQEPHPRDQTIRFIRKSSREKWKEISGYHRRSLIENTMFRLKTVFLDKLHARKYEQQTTEMILKVNSLNKMFKKFKPISYVAA